MYGSKTTTSTLLLAVYIEGQKTLRDKFIHLPRALYRIVFDPTGMRSRLENCVVFAAAPRTPCEMHFQLSSLFLQPVTKKVGLHRLMIAGQRQVKVSDILQSQFSFPKSRVPKCEHQYYFSSKSKFQFQVGPINQELIEDVPAVAVMCGQLINGPTRN